MKTMVTPDEALSIILEQVVSLPPEDSPHEISLGRTLANDVVADIDLPPFDNSAMDGYAVIAADLQHASAGAPVALPCLEIIGAGQVPQTSISSGQCTKIMTGAPLPAGADAVVMREETSEVASGVEFTVAPQVGQNIRLAGSDVAQGKVVLLQGTQINAAQWAMLASLGRAQVSVTTRPRVGIISTGAELVAIDAPLLPGQIRDSNSYALRALVESCGAEVTAVRHSGDSLAEFEAVLQEVAGACDLVITSGGVSAGDFDPVRDVLREKAEVFFWKIAMKPGKPVMFANFEGTLVFGLPGNPASVMVAFEEFTRPALLKMGGRRALQRVEVPAKVKTGLTSPANRVEYLRAVLRLENGGWVASIDNDQGSGRLSTFTRANALLVVPAETTKVEAGEILTARLIDCPEID
ncbi:molybdopterin molybdenumtransferase MoeA [bacterium]|nr:MAG: molybdopterin molybdenumtransferase MoeA [bacterium]